MKQLEDEFHMGWNASAVPKPPTPRVKSAIRLYVSGAAPTQKEAAQLAGINAKHFQIQKRNPFVKAYIRQIEADIDAGTVQMSNVIRELGRRGVETIAKMMESDEVKDELRLKAAVDLADRSPETSKTNKLSIEGGLTIQSADVSRLMAALVEGAEVAKEFDKEVGTGDYVRVDDGSHLLPAPKDG